MHLTAADMLCTMVFSGGNWKEESDSALQSVAWALCSAVSTMAGYTPGQLVRSKDMIMQNTVAADWEKIKQLTQSSAVISNARENKACLDDTYQVTRY